MKAIVCDQCKKVCDKEFFRIRKVTVEQPVLRPIVPIMCPEEFRKENELDKMDFCSIDCIVKYGDEDDTKEE